MGMFDTIKCSYNIGELTDVECQSKNIDDWGGTCTFYWVDPSGRLWSPSYAGTYDFVPVKGKYPDVKYLNTIPNGNHGRYMPVDMTRCIEMYTSHTHADGYLELTTCYLTFYQGLLTDYLYK